MAARRMDSSFPDTFVDDEVADDDLQILFVSQAIRYFMLGLVISESLYWVNVVVVNVLCSALHGEFMSLVGPALDKVQQALKVKKEPIEAANGASADDYPLASPVPQTGADEVLDDAGDSLEDTFKDGEGVQTESPESTQDCGGVENEKELPETSQAEVVESVQAKEAVEAVKAPVQEPPNPAQQSEEAASPEDGPGVSSLRGSESPAKVASKGEGHAETDPKLIRGKTLPENQLGDETLYPPPQHTATPKEQELSRAMDTPMTDESSPKGKPQQSSGLKRQRHLELEDVGAEEVCGDFVVGGDTCPPPVLTRNAILCRLRRIFKKRADGTTRLSQSWNDQWADEKGREEIESLFEKLGYNVERVFKFNCTSILLGLVAVYLKQINSLFSWRRSLSSDAKPLRSASPKRRWRLRVSGSLWQTWNALASVSGLVGRCPCSFLTCFSSESSAFPVLASG